MRERGCESSPREVRLEPVLEGRPGLSVSRGGTCTRHRYENGTTLRIARKGRGAAERLRHVRSRATPFDRRPILPRLVHCLYFPNVKKQRGSMLAKSVAPLMKRMKSIARKMIFAATHTVLRECAPLQRQWLRRRRHLRPRPKHCEASIPVGSFRDRLRPPVRKL